MKFHTSGRKTEDKRTEIKRSANPLAVVAASLIEHETTDKIDAFFPLLLGED